MSEIIYLEMLGFTRAEIRLIDRGLCDADEVACAKECQQPSHFLQWLNQERHHEAA